MFCNLLFIKLSYTSYKKTSVIYVLQNDHACVTLHYTRRFDFSREKNTCQFLSHTK